MAWRRRAAVGSTRLHFETATKDADLRTAAAPKLNDAQLAVLRQCTGATLRRHTDGDRLISAGDLSFDFFVVVSGELVDPLQVELLNAACLANALGWLAGTLLVARVRVLEYLDAQETA